MTYDLHVVKLIFAMPHIIKKTSKNYTGTKAVSMNSRRRVRKHKNRGKLAEEKQMPPNGMDNDVNLSGQ